VPAENDDALSQCLRDYVDAPDLCRAHGTAGRIRIEREFSLTAMVERYLGVYDSVLGRGAP